MDALKGAIGCEYSSVKRIIELIKCCVAMCSRQTINKIKFLPGNIFVDEISSK